MRKAGYLLLLRQAITINPESMEARMSDHSFFRTSLFALLIGLAASPAAAQDIYVKPSTGGTQPPAVEYGIKQRPKEAPKPPPQNPAPQPPSPQPVPEPVPPPTTPAPTPSPPVSPPPNAEPVSIYQMPEDDPPDPGQGPNMITIGFQPGLLGPSDKNAVLQSLGLNETELLRNCVFRYSSALSYGADGGTMLASGSAASIQHRYTGQLTFVQVFPSLACKKLRAPAAGMVLEQGPYYIVSLNTSECPPGAKGTAGSVSLSFRYTGDGTSECRYQ
jgi:hypothetical protein